MTTTSGRFLGYEQLNIRDILVLSSFAVLLPVAHVVSEFFLQVGLTGQILLGGIYGLPVAGLLHIQWQQSFSAVGYLGLIILIFEGAVSTDIKLFGRNLVISILCAFTGIILPIALSMFSATVVFNHSPLQAFVAGASLSATSMGTTIAVIQGRDTIRPSLFETSIVTILLSAAVLDDIVGLIMASVITKAQESPTYSLAWVICRPLVASISLAAVTIFTAKTFQILGPFLGKWQLLSIVYGKFRFRILLVISLLMASTTAAFYAGTSVLFGAFIAGLLISFLENQSGADGAVNSEPSQSSNRISLKNDFRQVIGPIQDTCLVPLFFASMGFSIPFRDLWSPRILWQGCVYTVLMAVGKLAVALWILVYSYFQEGSTINASDSADTAAELDEGHLLYTIAPALFLGAGMVARGEIGLLICQIGFNSGKGTQPYDLFLVSVWALLVNTVAGPILVGSLLSRWRPYIIGGRWGFKKRERSA